MTNHRDDSERDPALARAWAAQSRETPPPALDQALLAAAHRAVGAGPRDATEAAAQARRPQRWWMPLAAAAVIGVVAIGVIQTTPETQLLTPHEKLMPLPQETASAPVAAAKPDAAQADVAKPRTTSEPDAAKANDAGEQFTAKRDAASERIAQSPPRHTADAGRANAPSSAAAPSVAAPSGATPAVAAPEAASRPARPQAAGGRVDVTPGPVPAPVPAPVPPTPAAPATAGKLADAPVPFPAATGERKTEALAPSPAPPAATADTRAMPAPAAPAAPVRTPFGTNETRKERQAPAAAAPSPPPPLSGAPSEAAGMAASPPTRDIAAEREGVRPQALPMSQGAPTTLAKSATATADARAQARDPEAWLVRIRKLRDDGDVEGAARELREFRSLVPDADARIPADLRDWAATIR